MENVVAHTTLVPNREQAEMYLKWLDPQAQAFTFQTFDDNADRKAPELARVLHGSVDQHWDTLVRLNRLGAGVYVTVNETDLTGRRAENIIRIRAIWQEDDAGDAPALPIAPHIIVQSSPGKFHRYVLVRAQAGEGLEDEQFEGVEQRLVNDYGSDPNAKDRARVLRLPGFFHAKVNAKKGLEGKAYRVEVLEWNSHPRLTWAEILEHFPPADRPAAKRAARRANKPQLHLVSESGLSRIPEDTPKEIREWAMAVLPKLEEKANKAENTITDEDYQMLWSALLAIDGADRDVWVAVGHELKTIYNPGWGWTLWHAWSARYDGYVDEADCRLHWEGFKPGRSNWRGIFTRAQDAGWINPKSRAGQRAIAREAIDSEQEISLERLLSCDPETDKSLVMTYREQEREKFRRDHGLVMLDGKVAIAYRIKKGDTNRTKTEFSSVDAVKKFHQDHKLPRVVESKDGDGARLVFKDCIVEDWMDRPDKAKYRYIEFMPAPGKVADLSMPVGEGFNLYIGTTFTPAPGRCDLILNHIQQVWCRGNEVAYDYVIQWLARMVQFPQERGETVIVLRSGQGAGKNIIADIFQEYFGVHTCMLTNTEHLAGFNDHLSYAVFVFLNEAIWGGNKKLEGTIKSIITDKSLRTEKKFYSQVETRNCTHIMVATNEDWSVPVGHDDRRFFMLDLDNSKIGDATYFGALADQVNHGGDRAFVHHLMHVDLSAFDVRKMPNLESQVKLDHKIRSADRITQWWLDVLTEGAFIVKHKDGVSGPQRIDWPDDQELCINTNHLYEAFESRARGAHIEGHTTVARKLADLLGIDGGGHGEYAGLRVKRARTNDPINSRPRQYVLPSLKDARAAAERYLKQSGPWAYEVDGDQQAEDGPSHPVRPAPPTPPVRPRCAGNQ